MIVYNNRGEPTTIDRTNFAVGSGGEGDVYVINSRAIKIYHEKSKVIPEKKMQELNLIQNKNIITPNGAIYDSNKNLIGYEMDSVNGNPLSRIFSNNFRSINSINKKTDFKLITSIKEGFKDIHKAKCLVVDGNEMNFLTDSTYSKVYFIDTDSFKTPNFRPTAFSVSTKDPLIRDSLFSEESDWFIFAIIATQIISGIHPFKGRHVGGIKGLEARISKGISIFNKDVNVPPSVRDITNIPNVFREWLELTLSNKLRVEPPEFDTGGVIVKTGEIISNCGTHNGVQFKVTKKYLTWGSKKIKLADGVICQLNEDFGVQLFKIQNGQVMSFTPSNNKEQNTGILADNLLSLGEKVFSLKGTQMSEISSIIVNGDVIYGLKGQIDVYPRAIHLFYNILIQSCLNSNIVTIVEGDGVRTFIIKELNGKSVLNAKYSENNNKITIVATGEAFKYKMITIKLNKFSYIITGADDTDVINL